MNINIDRLDRMKIVYYSGSGNTEKMAKLISDGLIIQYEPENSCSECIKFGIKIAEE